ncbi:MAG: acetolactate synthase large subunit [Candidatus Nanopelagicus sp.]|jgi:acetolactate synthase-1/2/3 large subunit|nr:acetolactate synthase large subunit [Candidatus Nanopelagicus sp.]
MSKMNGAQSLINALEAAGVDVMFGIPGGAILPAYDPIFDSKIRHILVRHEQGAGHAATGYAQATGRVGVCIATSGPGATNLVTPLADAQMDSVPIVAITGQVPSAAIGTDAFQEADIRGVTMPVTKHNYLITDPADIPRAIAEAFHIASTGRPGAVLVDIAKDALQKETTFNYPKTVSLAGYNPVVEPKQSAVLDAAALIAQSKKPVLYVGGGVIKANAAKELMQLAEITGVPVVTTLMARGAFPDSHKQHLGMPGMHGTVAAVTALQKADLLITLGARFDDRVTGKLSTFAPKAKIIHADIDPAEIGKNRHADVALVGDLKNILRALNPATKAALAKSAPDLTPWLNEVYGWRSKFPLGYDKPSDGSVSPQNVIERIGKISGPDTIFTAGVGQHQMWASQFIGYEKPRTWLNSGGLGTMGYAVPAAMGAKVGAPDTTVWAIDGDGCFQMTNQELVTCAINNIPIKVAVINNESLGMVRQWQTLFYNQRYSNTDLHSKRIPDFKLLAEAMGCVGLRCERPEDVDKTIEAAMEINDRPVVVDFNVHRDAMVWPMVAAGTSNDDITVARSMAPVWDSQEL